MLFFNFTGQAFCVPTTWAAWVIAVCFANTIIYPVLGKTIWSPLTNFINGVSLCLFAYCILFLEQMNWAIFLIFLILPMVIFIPHFLFLQILSRNILYPKKIINLVLFLIPPLLAVPIVRYIGAEYKAAMVSIQKFEESGFTVLDKNFMTEKILGMHFIYHTRYDFYDGWRPPKHEPIMVIGMWMNGRVDPLKVDLKTRLTLYKQFFPENPYKFDCSCGMVESYEYHNDPLWRE